MATFYSDMEVTLRPREVKCLVQITEKTCITERGEDSSSYLLMCFFYDDFSYNGRIEYLRLRLHVS